MNPTISLDLQIATKNECPPYDHIIKWISAALVAGDTARASASLTLRVVEPEEVQQLNKEYRQKDKPTNVLAFPCALPEMLRGDTLGDIVLCASIVEQEATAQHKTLESHWAHMVIHSTLHLLGFDHQTEHDATIMESLETHILDTLEFQNPYSEVLK